MPETCEDDSKAAQLAQPRRAAASSLDRERSLQLVAGMPELNACGLSEAWLQRTCGSQHWLALSHALGRPSDRWADTQGRRVYAAFGWLRLREARLDLAEDGQALRLNSHLRWLGRSHAWSRHGLAMRDGSMAELDMLSVFVSRHSAGDNHSVRRANMPSTAVDEPAPETSALLVHLRQWRQASETRTPPVLSWRTTPCPRSDFNGAGLLYFPSFTTLADRALWHWGLLGTRERIVGRECLFLGNIALGESVEVRLLEDRMREQGRRVLLQVVSVDESRRLAEIWVVVSALKSSPHAVSGMQESTMVI